jgi:site-specific recombinase XerD
MTAHPGMTPRLLLGFAHTCLKKGRSQLTIEDLTPTFIGRFLDHLEKERGNAARTRNVRLAAMHSFFKFAALGTTVYRPCSLPSGHSQQTL